MPRRVVGGCRNLPALDRPFCVSKWISSRALTPDLRIEGGTGPVLDESDVQAVAHPDETAPLADHQPSSRIRRSEQDGSTGSAATRPTLLEVGPALAKSESSVRRARFAAASVILGLVGVGTAIAAVAETGSLWRDLGLAVLSGAVVGGALVSVESMLAGAAEVRSKQETLLSQLSSTMDLNGIDLSGRNLDGLYLPGRAMVAARLVGTGLANSRLYFSDLRHADLRGASLRGADLSGSTLAFADLRGADLRGAVLDDADLSDTRLDEADLRGAVVRGGRLQRSRLQGAMLGGALIETTFLDGADLSSARIQGLGLREVEYDECTRWPAGFEPPATVGVVQDDISSMDLPTYLMRRQTTDG